MQKKFRPKKSVKNFPILGIEEPEAILNDFRLFLSTKEQKGKGAVDFSPIFRKNLNL